MATHIYDNPGPKETHTNTNIGGVVGVPVTTYVTLRDGTDHLSLLFTDLDALDETVHLLEQARSEHIAALCDGRSEVVHPDALRPEDLVVIDGELVMVCHIVLENRHVIVNYSKKYEGMFDLTATRSMRVMRSETVKRLLPALAVVS